MNKSELRIGNLVYQTLVDNFDKRPLSINKIQNGSDIDNAFWWIPIEITEPLLIQLGFEKEYDSDGSGDFDFIRKVGRKTIILRYDIDGNWYLLQQRNIGLIYDLLHEEIKYIHQVQNFHFDLTGEEITIVI